MNLGKDNYIFIDKDVVDKICNTEVDNSSVQKEKWRPEMKAILFDLDGTLLPMDTDEFVKVYMKELAKRVAHIHDPQEFSKALWAGTHAMIKSTDETKSNEQVFQETFLALLGLEKEQIWPTLDAFYRDVFPSFSYLCEPTPLARKVVEAALAQGFKVAVATNPLFPRTAIDERIRWAGLGDVKFDYVTVYENSFFTKPHLQYYRNICVELGVKPEKCMMVGNDRQEDMTASIIGMRTYLVEGNIIDRGEPSYQVDMQGTLEDLYNLLVEG